MLCWNIGCILYLSGLWLICFTWFWLKLKKKNTYFGKTVKIMVKCLDANFDSWNLREFYRHFEDGAIIGPRSAFTLVFWRGKYLKKKKKKGAGVTLQKKLMCTLKGEFLDIGFTTGTVGLHVLEGEGNKTDKCYWAWKMVKLCAQALPFPKCFQYSTLSCKHLMKTNLLCVCIQYQQTWCRNKKFGSLFICSIGKVVLS